jgi:hypothetical protein
MWRHPITKRQVKVLEEDWGVCEESVDLHEDENDGWFELLRPQEKELACGDGKCSQSTNCLFQTCPELSLLSRHVSRVSNASNIVPSPEFLPC